jgi:UDPglucose 6-dehydrogenase
LPATFRVGVLGLTFKTGTNDLRDSPATRIARALPDHGVKVTAHDPTVLHRVSEITTTSDVYNVTAEADPLLLLTDWPEYHALDWPRIAQSMTGDLVLDTRNTLAREHLDGTGLRCVSIGRGNPARRATR